MTYIFPRQIVLSLALVAAASAQWPAGVSPAACPNYPYCGEAAAPVAYAAALSADPALRYPAGVSAASCPNYPDCFQGRNSSVSLSLSSARGLPITMETNITNFAAMRT